jgi:hypothetical protein
MGQVKWEHVLERTENESEELGNERLFCRYSKYVNDNILINYRGNVKIILIYYGYGYQIVA